MHITSGLSPASGELYEDTISYLDDTQGSSYESGIVPESSHTVEIECLNDATLVSNHQYSTGDKSDDVTLARKRKRTTTASPEAERQISKPLEHGETDLTNLNWLQNITNIMKVPNLQIPSTTPTQPKKSRLTKFNQTIAKCQKDFLDNLYVYQNCGEKKPPYSYSTMICMAMRENNDKITLSAIYEWIKNNFKYYREADPTWQNSIRHNLSLNKVFVKVARSKQEPGKGGFWKLDLTHLDVVAQTKPKKTQKKKSQPLRKAKEPEVQVEYIEKCDDVTPQPGDVILDAPLTDMNQEYTLEIMQPLQAVPAGQILQTNVVVEPAVPPSLMPEEDLSSLLLNPMDWGDLQLEMLDSLLDSCFK